MNLDVFHAQQFGIGRYQARDISGQIGAELTFNPVVTQKIGQPIYGCP